MALSCEYIDGNADNPVVINAYKCYDSACDNCSDTAVNSGWDELEDIAGFLNEETAHDACKVWKTVEESETLELMFSNTSDYSHRYGPADQVRGYTEVFVANT